MKTLAKFHELEKSRIGRNRSALDFILIGRPVCLRALLNAVQLLLNAVHANDLDHSQCQELLSQYCGVYPHILAVADSLLIIHHR